MVTTTDLARRRDPQSPARLWQISPMSVPAYASANNHSSFLATHWRVGARWCVPDGPETHGAYCLRMLLDPDGAAVFWRCYEPLVGRGARSLCPARKDFAIGHWLAYAVGGVLVVWGVCLVASG